MDYLVKNNSWRDKAFKVLGGLVIVPAGSEKRVEGAYPLSETQIAKLAKGDCTVEEAGAVDLSKMKVEELKELADREQIDLGDATKKDDIIAAIQLGREAKA
ncbi:hypothetical protein [Sphingobium yanoikuyae]|uniref:hypothetical protein n=1 Tax=Sphingobium yanoikuyae TaxID=13690 RepID=UPI0028AF4A74|nr:hypothetical protein [Sphingobium yanoikuyae]